MRLLYTDCSVDEASLKKSGHLPPDRIRQASLRLFRERGYTRTGVADLLEASGCHKKSFYRYFSSKADLGSFYIASSAAEISALFLRLAAKSRDLHNFIDRWMDLVQRQYRLGARVDCPIGRFRAQVSPQDGFDQQIDTAVRNVIAALARAVAHFVPEAQAAQVSARLFLRYQGGIRLVDLGLGPEALALTRSEMHDVFMKSSADGYTGSGIPPAGESG